VKLAALVASALLMTGCGLDHTGRSASYLMDSRIDANRDRARSLERDVQLERARVDSIEERAANARRLLADSGATLETFLAELQRVRGELAELKHSLGEKDRLSADVDFRLTTLEVTIAHVMKELDVAPPSMLGVTYSGDAGLGSMEPATDEMGEAVDGVDIEPEPTPEPIVPSDETKTLTEELPAPPKSDSKEDAHFGAALVDFKASDWESAGTRLQKFAMKYPDSKWWLQAQFLIGQCLYELGRYKPAITEYQQVIEKDEKSQWAARSMFMQGMAFQELGTPEDIDAAKVFFAELVRLYPDRPEAERGQTRLEALDAQ
jgi:tol-pal system protein YbgF